jgi:hypothetical protein
MTITYVHKKWRAIIVLKKSTFRMEKFNDDEKINICIGDFKWCVYNVHDKASFIMVIKT